MVTKFVIRGKGETSVEAVIKVKSTRQVLTRGEVMRKRRNLENEIHAVLCRFGFDVSEIVLK